MSAPLSDVHQASLARYVAFFKYKREKLIAERETDRVEFKEDRLFDESALFNKMDVDDLIEAYHAQVVGCIREGVEEITNLSSATVAALMQQAEAAGMALDADVTTIADQNRPELISAMISTGSAPPLASRAQVLAPLETTATIDPEVAQRIQDLEDANAQWVERDRRMQTEMADLLKERSSLATELERVNENVASLKLLAPESASNPHVIDIEYALAETNDLLAAKQGECDQMRQDLNFRLADSSPFRELQAIVKKKTDQVKQMRQIMSSYGIALPVEDTGVELTADDD